MVYDRTAASTDGMEVREVVLHAAQYAAGVSLPDIVAAEPMLRDGYGFKRVYVNCTTDRVLLVPLPLFEPERVEQYLDAANLFEPGKITLSNDQLSGQAAAVWQAESTLAAKLHRYYPRACFYHPLLLELDTLAPRTVHVALEEDLAHITVYHDSLYAAESLRFGTPEDLLYYILKLCKNDGFSSYKLIFSGSVGEGELTLFQGYFAAVEVNPQSDYMYQRIRERCE